MVVTGGFILSIYDRNDVVKEEKNMNLLTESGHLNS